jgi:hypothetical protein
MAVTSSAIGVPVAVPPAETVSQLGKAGLAPMVKGVPLVAAEETLTVCAAPTTPLVELHVKLTELGEGASADPCEVTMLMVTGTLRAVPTAGVKTRPKEPPGTAPLQPGAMMMLKTTAVLIELTVLGAGSTTGPPEPLARAAVPVTVTV